MFEYRFTGKHYHTLDYYLKTKYQNKVCKIPLNASFTCPNRDGTKGVGGCIFCSNQGSGDFAGNPKDDLDKQYQEIKTIMSKKWPNSKYIIYFQAFSNTYGSIDKLKQTFEPFINKENVIGLSIATRCDCINEEIVSYLKKLQTHFKEFWVELGLQSAKTSTMKLLNLKYTFNDFKNAVLLLNKASINVVVHIIDGLPYENELDQINTIKKISKLPIQGIKIHILNVLGNTKLGMMYQNEHFKILDEDEFVNLVVKQLTYLKDDVIIHRIGADSNPLDLIAPLWVRKKISILDKIDLKMANDDIYQGDNY